MNADDDVDDDDGYSYSQLSVYGGHQTTLRELRRQNSISINSSTRTDKINKIAQKRAIGGSMLDT